MVHFMQQSCFDITNKFFKEYFCKYKGMYVMTYNCEGCIKNLILAGMYTKVDEFCRYMLIWLKRYNNKLLSPSLQ